MFILSIMLNGSFIVIDLIHSISSWAKKNPFVTPKKIFLYLIILTVLLLFSIGIILNKVVVKNNHTEFKLREIEERLTPFVNLNIQNLEDSEYLSIDNISSLRAIEGRKEKQQIRVLGYYTLGDIGDIPSYYWDPKSTLTDNGGSVIKPNSTSGAGRWVWGSVEYINPKWFGAVADGVTDDTEILQFVFDNYDNIELFGSFAVSTLKVSSSYNFIYSRDATLNGIATDTTEAILVFEDAKETILQGRLNIRTDGNSKKPVYHDNYGCGVLIRSKTNTSDNSQFMWLEGIRISNMKMGLVLGSLDLANPQPYVVQSEIWIKDYQVRGVQKVLLCNAINQYVTFTNSLLLCKQFEASKSWWDDSDSYCLNVNAGQVVFNGTEIVKPDITDNYSMIINAKTSINNFVLEAVSPIFIKNNDLTMRSNIDGYYGNSTDDFIKIDQDAKGVLTLDDVKIYRPSGTSAYSTTNLINCANNFYRINITNSNLEEWRYTLNSSNAHLIKGGRLVVNNTKVTSVQSDLYLDSYNPIGLLLSCDGTDMTSSRNILSKSGWQTFGSPANGSWYAQSPVEYNGLSAIRMHSPLTSLRIATPFINVGGIENIIIDMLARSVSTGSGYLRIHVNYYDFDGNFIDQSTPFNFDHTRFQKNGYQDNLLPLRVFQNKNKAASKIRIEFFLSSMTLDFTNFKIILN